MLPIFSREITDMKAAVLTLVFLAPLTLLHAAESSKAATRPNIVFIMADDHGRQAASCYGSKLMN